MTYHRSILTVLNLKAKRAAGVMLQSCENEQCGARRVWQGGCRYKYPKKTLELMNVVWGI